MRIATGLWPLALAAAMLVPSPVQAAKQASLACLTNGTAPETRKAIADDFLRSMKSDGGASTPEAERAIEAMGTQAGKCRVKHGWTEAELGDALLHSFADINLPIAEGHLAQLGYNTSVVKQAFQSLPKATRDSFEAGDVPEASVTAYMAATAKAGVEIPEKHAEQFGIFAALLAMSSASLERFVGGQ